MFMGTVHRTEACFGDTTEDRKIFMGTMRGQEHVCGDGTKDSRVMFVAADGFAPTA
jgi:hypothetical protein